MKKLAVGILVASMAATSLVGCAGGRVWIKCEQNSEGRSCEGGGETYQQKSGGFISAKDFDASKLHFDFSGSTGSLLVDSMYVRVTTSSKSVGNVGRSFRFLRVGSRMYPESPATINAWVDNLGVEFSSLRFSYSGLAVSSRSGANVASFEVVYDGMVLNGGSDSWYVSPRQFPPRQLH